MAQLIRLCQILLCCFIVATSVETDDSKLKNATQFVLDSFNGKRDSAFVYNSPTIINSHITNGSQPLYFLQLDFSVNCNRSTDCTSSHLICEVVVREDSTTNAKIVLEDKTKCAKKETESVFPTNGHGFIEDSVRDEVRSIAAFAVQQSEVSGEPKRSVIDIMSIKRQVNGNGTTLYLTLKVTRPDGGDASLFEVCEAEVNQIGQTAFESNLTCFPLNGMLPDVPLSPEDITAVAERAADELDSLSFSEFTLKLLDVLKAETTVTPGSEGTVTTLELRLVPTLCLKNVDVEGDSDGLYEKRQCPENTSNRRLICSVTSWDRPWLDDTLYSEPVCRQDRQNVGTDHVEHTSETVKAVQEDNLNAMMNDQIEPVKEDTLLPTVEHHSIPVVEELEPVVEQIIPNVEESHTPVVEESFVISHTYCTGCLTDLDVNNSLLQKYVDQAIAMIDQSSNGKYLHKATKISKAQKQVVNGVKYIFHIEVVETSCLKGLIENNPSCEPNMDSVKTCVVEFLEKPWLNSNREIISNNCTEYNNDLENEIEPHFTPDIHAGRREIYDYLDALDEPEPINDRISPSYGRDSLYLPENEPENQPTESDAEEIEINMPEEIEKNTDKMKLEGDSKGFEDSEHNSNQKSHDTSSENERNSHEDEDNSSEERVGRVSMYVTGEDRNRRETIQSNFGSLKEIDESEKGMVKNLAEIAINTLDEIDEDDTKRVIIDILSAKKQIVNGVLYHLLLRVGTTSCSENGESKPDCLKDHVSPVKICKVELHRSFADNSQMDAKVVKSECSPEETNLPEKEIRQKRSIGSVITGGPSSADTADSYIVQLANFAVSELDKATNSLYSQCVVRIVSATKQLASGYIVHLVLEVGESNHRKGETNEVSCELNEDANTKICHVTIWDRAWIQNSSQITDFNCSSSVSRARRELSTSRVKRQIPGGLSPANVSDPVIQEMANIGLNHINNQSNSACTQEVVRIIEASQQVVAGMMYIVTMEVGCTTCHKGQNGDSNTCNQHVNSNNQICVVKIWDKPWLNFREVQEATCSAASQPATETANRAKRELPTSRVKRQIPGGLSPANVSDPVIQEMANIGLNHINSQSNSACTQEIVRIIEARKQVVAGMMYTVTMEVGCTTCLKGQNGDANICNQHSNNQICVVKVWDKPWLNFREVQEATCSAASQPATETANRAKREQSVNRRKRHADVLVGAPIQADINDPAVQEMANLALTELDRTSNALYKQKIVHILEARKQVVSGLLWHLTLELAYSNCRKGRNNTSDTCEVRENSNNQICNVQIWEREWLNQREVKNISCHSTPQHRMKRKSRIGGGSHDIHIGMFKKFMKKYNKHYADEGEYKHRFHIYRANMKKVEHLQRTEQGTARYGATQFADLTTKEFKKYYLGLRPDLRIANNIPLHQAKIPAVTLPQEFDWRHYNVVTEVKNQGVCGSCWAFSVTGNIEGQWAINKGKLYSLSEQELVDCDTLDSGCEGGLPDNAYRSIEKLGGLETEKDYPYEGEDEKCHFNRTDVKVTIQGAVNITKNETGMAKWLYKNGPISIGINANAMQFYMGGISHPLKFLCDPNDLDHGVLIVGYGVHEYPIFEKVLPFWIIKNSWGERWGEQGYYRVYRGDGTCGVNQMATSAIVG
ncbi:uncharacterized protein [Periplaneta americana]|uniref:uncharacterized protein isoform X1 n=1 Tax=Periplaneta americana TaxID=6978 RepID=UPI0037E84347